MLTESELDNILVKQKDRILSLINAGRTDTAREILFIVCDLWFKCNYGYKYQELIDRIKKRDAISM